MDDDTGVEGEGRAHAYDFCQQAHKDIFDLDQEENKLEYTTVYQDFQNKFEAKLEGFLAANGYTTEQMVDACKAQVNNEGAMGIDIVGVILATLEYDVFLQMMHDAKTRFA
eukprot:3933470-Rhodomonas_salina.1